MKNLFSNAINELNHFLLLNNDYVERLIELLVAQYEFDLVNDARDVIGLHNTTHLYSEIQYMTDNGYLDNEFYLNIQTE